MTKVCVLSSALVLVACGGDSADVQWSGTVDTLADGRVAVHSPAAGVWDSAATWTMVEELRIGSVEGTGPELFDAVAGIEVDALGRIWVLDRNAKDVRVFDRAGAHVRTIGREGAGPGEFRDPIGLALRASGEVWVTDPGNARYAVFDTSGEYRTSHVRKVAGYAVPWRGGFDSEGRLLEAASVRVGDDYRVALVRYDVTMQPVDTIPLPEFDAAAYEVTNRDGSISANVPYAPTLIWAFQPDGIVWSGVNREYSVYQQTFAGDTLRAVSRDYQPVAVTSAERDTAIARMSWFTSQGGVIDASRVPGRKPAFSRIDVAPDGHLWISVTPPTRGAGTPFDIFDAEGRYLGQVRSPTSLRRGLLFRGDHLYGATADTLGVTYVVRMRVVRPAERDQ